jgi:lipopolysaccharide export system permease protein
MGLLDRYILRAVVTPLFLALLVAGALLLLDEMLRLFDFVLAEQGPVNVVWRLLASLLPHYLSLALPLGAFLGVLIAFRNLSMSSELDALNSSGAPAARLLRPVYGLMLVLIVLDFLLVSYISPFASYRYARLRFDVTSGAFGIKIPQGEFIDVADDTTIRLGKISAETGEVEGIYVEQRRPAGGLTVITARSGGIASTPDLTRLLLKLRDGRQLFVDSGAAHANVLSFNSLDVDIKLPAIAVFRARGADEREATFSELLAFFRDRDKNNALWDEYQAGFHWQLIHPLTFLVIPVLAVATGVAPRRRTSNLRPIMGTVILIAYHELVQEWGQVVVRDGRLSPYVSMWAVFAVFVAVSAFLYRGSIDRARAARVLGRPEPTVVRVLSDAELDEDSLEFDVVKSDRRR